MWREITDHESRYMYFRIKRLKKEEQEDACKLFIHHYHHHHHREVTKDNKEAGAQLIAAQRTALEAAKLKDLKAKNYLFQAIDRSILKTILCKDTSKHIWDSMKKKHQGKGKKVATPNASWGVWIAKNEIGGNNHGFLFPNNGDCQ